MSVADAFARQIAWCERLEAPFTARVLRAVVAALPDAMRDWAGDAVADAVPLRVAACLHALVLAGTDPALAACYPPHPPDAIEAAVARALHGHAAALVAFVAHPPQTNEVGRAAVLAAGFHAIAAQMGLPLSLLEIGASAGLNLRWDAYRTPSGGPLDSPVRLDPDWSGPPPPMADVRVVARAGCDAVPVDLRDHAARLRLRAYTWAEQTGRRRRLDAAIGLALLDPPAVARADAAEWLHTALPAALGPDHVTVVYHSVVWHYLPVAQQSFIIRTMAAAAATGQPLAWLRMEPPEVSAPMQLTLRTWPGSGQGGDGWRTLADVHPHGAEIRWR